MGIKRIVIAVVVVTLVLGLTILLLFQSGVDEKVISAFLPKIEQRFGIKIKYDKLNASLTSLSLEGFRVADKATGCRYATAKEVFVGVRMGPLFFGEVDLTGIRIDQLEVAYGQRVNGCEPTVWKNFVDHLTPKQLDSSKTPSSSYNRPEIQLNSARIVVDNNFIKGSLDNISGQIGNANQAVLEAGPYSLSSNGMTIISGDHLDAKFFPEEKRLHISPGGAVFELVAQKKQIMTLARNLAESIAPFLPPKKPGASQESDDSAKPTNNILSGYQIEAQLDDGKGTIINPDSPNQRVVITDIFITTSFTDKRIMMNAGGNLPGGNEKFALSVSSDINSRKLDLKMPTSSLTDMGNTLFPSSHIDWSGASLNTEFHVQTQKASPEIEVFGNAAVSNLTVHHERLSEQALQHFDFNTDFKFRLNPAQHLVLIDHLDVSRKMGRFSLKGDINLERIDLNLQLSIPKTACNNIRDALPEALIPKLKQSRFEGNFAAEIKLDIDSEDPENAKFSPSINNKCRFVKFGDVPDPNYFRGPFSYIAYTADKDPIRIVTGRGTDRWTPYREISPFLIETVLTTEDGKFWHHSGITAPEIRRAIELNLKKESLSHGASTITMQLAKNLLLDRSRTIERKVQEIVLVWYLESYFTKEELLELYFNVVEFGPSIYGIKDAALHYFGREPYDLNLVESVYLVKLLPNPSKRHKSYEKGKLGEKQKKMLKRVMKTMYERHRITDVELSEGLLQEIVFHKAGHPLPAPRTRMGKIVM